MSVSPLTLRWGRGLTVVWKLGHGSHQWTGGHVALELLGYGLLVRRVKLLLEGDWLQGREPTPHVVDNRNGLRLCGGQT